MARTPSGRSKSDSRGPLDVSQLRSIGRFELIREIARGGMGQVFLARDVKLGRRVAIKFLLRDDASFVERFVVEARATARCTHENIVTIYEVGEHAGLPYMVLEYLEGKTLNELLETGVALQQFIEIMIAVVRALERAHEHGIVHRDLKPSNIFVTDRGQVKVLDFGIARLADRGEQERARVTAAMAAAGVQDTVFTGSNSLVGTIPYMAPEQWESDEVDGRADLWAVGIIFWRALTNVHPAGTVNPEKLRARLADRHPLPSIATQDPTLPRRLAAVIDRCVMKRVEDRYASASALLSDLNGLVAPTVDPRTGELAPYRGLAAFGENDAAYFFGRANETRTAIAQLDAWPVLAVIGPTGVGKSSFVRAGVLPALRASGGTWTTHALRPGRVPVQRLAMVLEAHGVQQAHAMLGQLVEAPGMFGRLLREAANARGHRVAIVVDQLEELFTLCDSDVIRHQFLAALLAAADDPSSPVRIIMSMRADFLDRFAVHKEFLSELTRGLFFLSAPDQDNMHEALVRPAELAGYAFEDRRIVDDMMQTATSRGALPLLSFAALRLWEARDRGRRLLTVAAYSAMGGIAGAFARHADQTVAGLPPHSQALLRAIVMRLVTPEGTRAVMSVAELMTLTDDRAQLESVLDHLVRARLLHLHQDPEQGTTVELAHEMLITEWPLLRRWVDDSHALRGFMYELRQAAKQWDARRRDPDLVWRGETAREALAHASRNVLDLSSIERDFLAAVRSEANGQRRRRVAIAATIAATLALVLAGGTIAGVRITIAERAARDKAVAAETALAEARAAKADLQKQYDVIKEKEAARDRAEREREQAQQLADRATSSERLTKEELQVVNKELQRRIAELQVAKEQALAANAKTEALLARERAANAKLAAQKRQIYDKVLK